MPSRRDQKRATGTETQSYVDLGHELGDERSRATGIDRWSLTAFTSGPRGIQCGGSAGITVPWSSGNKTSTRRQSWSTI